MDEPKVTIEVNRCPAHGFVERDHRCSEFDGVLRDGWTGMVIPEGLMTATRPDGPADNVKYLGVTKNGSQYKL